MPADPISIAKDVLLPILLGAIGYAWKLLGAHDQKIVVSEQRAQALEDRVKVVEQNFQAFGVQLTQLMISVGRMEERLKMVLEQLEKERKND